MFRYPHYGAYAFGQFGATQKSLPAHGDRQTRYRGARRSLAKHASLFHGGPPTASVTEDAALTPIVSVRLRSHLAATSKFHTVGQPPADLRDNELSQTNWQFAQGR